MKKILAIVLALVLLLVVALPVIAVAPAPPAPIALAIQGTMLIAISALVAYRHHTYKWLARLFSGIRRHYRLSARASPVLARMVAVLGIFTLTALLTAVFKVTGILSLTYRRVTLALLTTTTIAVTSLFAFWRVRYQFPISAVRFAGHLFSAVNNIDITGAIFKLRTTTNYHLTALSVWSRGSPGIIRSKPPISAAFSTG